MQWRDLIGIVIGAGFLFIVIRSISSQLRREEHVPLRGKLRAARDWLEGNGYRVIRVRERAEWIGYYGEREFRKQFIADFVVRHGAKKFAVKVLKDKEQGVTGNKLRDQWYPMIEALNVQGIIHIDVEREKIYEIDFELKSPPHVFWHKVLNRMMWLLTGAFIALAWLHGR